MGLRDITDNALGNQMIGDLLQEILQCYIVEGWNTDHFANPTHLRAMFLELYSGLGHQEKARNHIVFDVFLAAGPGPLLCLV